MRVCVICVCVCVRVEIYIFVQMDDGSVIGIGWNLISHTQNAYTETTPTTTTMEECY